MTKTGSAISLALAGLLGAATLPSRADITITAQETAGIGRAAPVTQNVTLYYKGKNARIEVSGEPALIQDGKANIIYGLNVAQKTYYMTVPTELEPGVGSPDKDDVKLDLKQTGKTTTLAGTTTHQYIVTGTVSHPRPEEGFRRGGGRRRGGRSGGGFPLQPVTVNQNGGDGSDGPGGEREGGRRGGFVSPAQWSITGEIWLSDAYKLPSKENTLFAAQLAASSAGPFQQPLADALDKRKGLPLLARITVDYIPASSEGKPINKYGGVVEGAKASTTAVTTFTTFTVKSVSEAPLSDTLFQVPLSDTLVAAPLIPYVPGTPVMAAP